MPLARAEAAIRVALQYDAGNEYLRLAPVGRPGMLRSRTGARRRSTKRRQVTAPEDLSSAAHTKPVITWPILVYDRTAAERFPFKRKWYRFNYGRASDDEVSEVLRLCGFGRREEPPAREVGLGQTRASFELGGRSGTTREILRYRSLFDYVPDETSLHADEENACAVLGVRLPPDSYFEDENEQPISLVQVLDEEARWKHGEGATAIVLDHPESILRHAPAEPIRAELWTRADADLMAHLSNVYAQLTGSRWLQSRCMVAFVAKDECQAVLPIQEDCMAVILPFRQLYSKNSADDLFNRCCKAHNRHCPPGHPTYHWVATYQARFNGFLEQPVTFPLNATNLPARRYLDAFAYGANVVHATGKKRAPAADLAGLLAEHAKELVVMGYHYILRTLLGYVSLALPVLGRNVTHWVSDLGWVGGGVRVGQGLFGI